MSSHVLYVGSKEDCPAVLRRVAESANVAAVFRKWTSSPTLLVLGDAAVLSLDPDEARCELARVAGRAVVCATGIGRSRLGRWSRAGFVLIDVDELKGLVESALKGPARPVIPAGRWPREPIAARKRATHAIQVLTELQVVRAVPWASALRCSRTTLRRLCLKAFAQNPRDIAWAYVVLVVGELRARSERIDACAQAVGYSDGVALLHAFARRGQQIPPCPPHNSSA